MKNTLYYQLRDLLVSILLSLASDSYHEDPISLQNMRRIVYVPLLPSEGRLHAVIHITQAGVSSTWRYHRLGEREVKGYNMYRCRLVQMNKVLVVLSQSDS